MSIKSVCGSIITATNASQNKVHIFVNTVLGICSKVDYIQFLRCRVY
jgi:hypothetical protein